MPIYEYRCDECGKVSEFLIGVTQEKSDIKCAACGSTKMQKVLSRSNIAASNDTECGGCDVRSKSCCPHGNCRH